MEQVLSLEPQHELKFRGKPEARHVRPRGCPGRPAPPLALADTGGAAVTWVPARPAVPAPPDGAPARRPEPVGPPGVPGPRLALSLPARARPSRRWARLPSRRGIARAERAPPSAGSPSAGDAPGLLAPGGPRRTPAAVPPSHLCSAPRRQGTHATSEDRFTHLFTAFLH